MAVKQFNPQPTGNTAQDSNNKQLREIIDAQNIEIINLKEDIKVLKQKVGV